MLNGRVYKVLKCPGNYYHRRSEETPVSNQSLVSQFSAWARYHPMTAVVNIENTLLSTPAWPSSSPLSPGEENIKKENSNISEKRRVELWTLLYFRWTRSGVVMERIYLHKFVILLMSGRRIGNNSLNGNSG